MSGFVEGFMSSAAPTIDAGVFRYLSADLGEGKPIATVAKVMDVDGLSVEENLELAALLAASPMLQRSLRECLGFVEAWMMHLKDTGNDRAAKTVADSLERARSAYDQSRKYRASRV